MTRRSLTNYFIMLGVSPVSWKSKKQLNVSRFFAEFEYRSMTTTSCELIFLKSLLKTFGVCHLMSMCLFCDSQVALHIVTNPVFS